MKKFNILKQNLIDLSVSKSWETAKKEWNFSHIYFDEEGGSCLCNQLSIKHVCVFHNERNSNICTIGSKCVEEFIGADMRHLFKSVQRMLKGKTMLFRTMREAYIRHVISYREYQLYTQLRTKRNELTNNETRSLNWINKKVLKRWTIED